MCVADLNVSTLPCQHRWYHLLRPCAPTKNLANCPSKLRLEGWEIRCAFCPWCSDWGALDTAAFRLFGNNRTPSSTGGLSRHTSNADSVAPQGREGSPGQMDERCRRGSLARTNSDDELEAAGERNRAMNLRIDAYLSSYPEKILQTDRRNSGDDETMPSPASESSSGGGGGGGMDTVKRSGSIFGKGWKKGKRMSWGLFR
ncbi:hypothetical protein BJ546DRAFT_690164 [Cryomyces antarcticus]